MIRSMTGFGAGTIRNASGEFSAEVKSLNNRFLDVSVKLPKELSFVEPEVREQVRRTVRRGKVDLLVRWISTPGAQPLYEINRPLLKHYMKEITEALGSDGAGEVKLDAGGLFSLPGVIQPARAAAENNELTTGVTGAVREALKNLDAARATEGTALAAAVEQHLAQLERLTELVAEAKEQLLEEYRQRLHERVQKIEQSAGASVDPVRLETETVLYADRSDITEELVRLKAHFHAVRDQLKPDNSEPVGKTLDFLVQELLREANTIGNKARGMTVAARIVDMKSEIEKIREQVQNLE